VRGCFGQLLRGGGSVGSWRGSVGSGRADGSRVSQFTQDPCGLRSHARGVLVIFEHTYQRRHTWVFQSSQRLRSKSGIKRSLHYPYEWINGPWVVQSRQCYSGTPITPSQAPTEPPNFQHAQHIGTSSLSLRCRHRFRGWSMGECPVDCHHMNIIGPHRSLAISRTVFPSSVSRRCQFGRLRIELTSAHPWIS
jgi:hypothetical protein